MKNPWILSIFIRKIDVFDGFSLENPQISIRFCLFSFKNWRFSCDFGEFSWKIVRFCPFSYEKSTFLMKFHEKSSNFDHFPSNLRNWLGNRKIHAFTRLEGESVYGFNFHWFCSENRRFQWICHQLLRSDQMNRFHSEKWTFLKFPRSDRFSSPGVRMTSPWRY